MGRNFNNPKSEPQDLSLAVSNSTTEDATTSAMVLLGCTRCLIYVMSSKLDLKCPKCNNTTLLDFFNLEEQASSSRRNHVAKWDGIYPHVDHSNLVLSTTLFYFRFWISLVVLFSFLFSFSFLIQFLL